MSAAPSGRGGTFCRFTVGSSKPGTSAKHLRYIANPQAVKEGREGVWLKEFPSLLLEAPYPLLVNALCAWASWNERSEIIGHKSKANVRTHYRAKLSFERSVSTAQAKAMLTLWMEEAFPRAQGVAFLHRNTQHAHLHVWRAARQTDGKKINLSARAFRQLDETWNRIYCKAMHRDEQEHLLKKGETERFKQLKREGRGQDLEKPERVGHRWKAEGFNERERERLGAKERGQDDRDEKGVGGNQRGLASSPSGGESRERLSPERERLSETSTLQIGALRDEAQRTVQAVEQLHQDAQGLVGPERGKILEPDREPER